MSILNISVLLPTYNSEKTISQAIKSILNQTFKNYEFLIIDDGSTDNTENIVKAFKDERIVYVKKEHTGLADTLNYGLKIAKYNWIARMDADDISHSQRLKLQINYLTEHNEIDWISCWYGVFDNKLRNIFKLPETSVDIIKNLILSSSICFPGSIFRKDKLTESDGFRGNVFEDYELLLRLKDRLTFYNIQKTLYYQRKCKNSLSRNNFDTNKNVIYKIQIPYYINLRKEFFLRSEKDVNIYKGWREFIYGDKEEARRVWNLLRLNIFLYPKVVIGYIITLLSQNYFKNLRKIGFNFLPYNSHFISSKERFTFWKTLKHLSGELELLKFVKNKLLQYIFSLHF